VTTAASTGIPGANTGQRSKQEWFICAQPTLLALGESSAHSQRSEIVRTNYNVTLATLGDYKEC
jgi:hypothetical protein